MKSIFSRFLIAAMMVIVTLSAVSFAETYTLSQTITLYPGSSASTGGFNMTRDVAFDQNGYMYVTNAGSARVLKLDLAGNWSIFGTGLSNPGSITYANGRMWVTDGNSIKYLYTYMAPTAAWTTLPINNSSTLSTFTGIAVTGGGTVYFSCSGTYGGAYVVKPAKIGGNTATRLYYSQSTNGVALDAVNRLYLSAQGSIYCSYNFVEQAYGWVRILGPLGATNDIACDSANKLYVAIPGSSSSIRKYDPATGVMLAQMGDYSTCRDPYGVTIKPGTTNVYTALPGSNKIVVFKPFVKSYFPY